MVIVVLMGNDGTGKTTLTKALTARLRRLGYTAHYHHGHEYNLLGFFFHLNPKRRAEVRDRYLDPKREKPLYISLWPLLVWFDAWIGWLLRRRRMDRVDLFDRYVYDYLLGWEYFGWSNGFVRSLYKRFPRPDLIFVLHAPPEVSFARKREPSETWRAFYAVQGPRYLAFARELGLRVIDTNETFERTFEELEGLILQGLRERGVDPHVRIQADRADRPTVLVVRFGTRAGIIGGGVTRLRAITPRLERHFDYRIVTHARTYAWFRELGIRAEPAHLIRWPRAWKQGVFGTVACGLLAALTLRPRERIDLVVGYTHSLPDLLPALVAGRRARAPLVTFLQTSPFPEKGGRSAFDVFLVTLDHWIGLWLAKRHCDRVFVFNGHHRKELIELGFDPWKVRTLAYGVDVAAVDAAPEAPRNDDAVFLGRISAFKGVFDLIEIWKRVVRVLPEARLTIVGPAFPEVRAELLRRIEAAGLAGRIFVRDPVYEEEKYALLKRHRLFLNPSWDESWCIALCEGMASGCAPVVYDLPVYKSVYGDGVVRAAPGDYDGFAQEVVQLLIDEDAWHRCAERARDRAVTYDWSRTAERERALFEEVLVDFAAGEVPG